MTTLKQNEEFLRAFDKPTQIYRYLHMRSSYSPIFLARNLSYMKGRKCSAKRKRPSFDWEKWYNNINRRNENRNTSNKSLVIKFLGFVDEKNVEVDGVDIDISLTQDKGKNNNNNDKNKHLIRSITVDANRFTTSLQPITITRNELLQFTTVADKSCVIHMDISYTVIKGEESVPRGRGRPRAAKRLQRCYDSQIHIFDKRGFSSLVGGEYVLHMNGNNMSAPRFDPKSTQKTLADYVAGNKKSAKAHPELKIVLKWNTNEYQPKAKSISVSPQDMHNQSVDYWCESIGNDVKRKFQTRHRDTYSSDDSICTGATKSTDDGDYVAHGSIESSTASTSSLSTSGVSSDMGSDDNEVVAITAKKIRDGFTVLSGLTDLHKYSGCRSSSIGIVDFGRRITYTFKYNQNGGQQTERCNGFVCPWCLLNCVRLHPLLMHLRLCHDRFRFEYEVKATGTCIDVSLNDQYNCALAAAKTTRFNALKRPLRRITYTKVLVSRHNSHYKHIKTYDELKNLLDDDEDGTPDAEETKYQENQRSMETNHNRLYYRTTNAMPHTHSYDFDNDSEGEHDPEWQRAYTHRQINDFTDVNEGEKELFQLWNLFVTKRNLFGDCRMQFACESFVDVHGKDIWAQKLYRNFLLHLCNLQDFGLLRSSQINAIVQRLQAINSMVDGESMNTAG